MNTGIDNISNSEKIAIVAVGYNRLGSLKRLFSSLLQAKYSTEVPLVICIDNSGCQDIYNYVNSFEWPFGEKYVFIQKERLGLKNHILFCGDLTKYFKGVIILEDDIYVGEGFYSYTKDAVEYYDSDSRIAGISLYRNEMDGNIPIDYIQDGIDVYLIQSVASWGECWTRKMWKPFREWYNRLEDQSLSKYDMPQYIKNWPRAWSKFYIAYLIETNRYYVFPNVSLTTCFSEAGEHGRKSTIGQVVLLSQNKKFEFKPFEDLTKYDVYSGNLDIYKWLNIEPDNLAIDMRGDNSNFKQARYIISPFSYPYKIVRSFALSLRPIELNIKYNIEGDGIYLYDTNEPVNTNGSNQIPISIAYYYLKTFNIKLLARYVYDYGKDAIFNKTIKKWKKILIKR